MSVLAESASGNLFPRKILFGADLLKWAHILIIAGVALTTEAHNNVHLVVPKLHCT